MDFYQDQGSFFVKCLHDKNVPDFVKQGSYESDTALATLPSSAFADSDGRLYPIHTAADTYVSAAYYFGKNASASKTSDVWNKIQKSARVFDIGEEINQIADDAREYQEHQKQAVSQELGWSFSTKTTSFSGIGASHLKEAAAHLDANMSRYDLEEREEIANNLQVLAGTHGVELPASISKLACVGSCSPELLELAIGSRVNALHDSREKEAFIKAASLLKDAEDLDSNLKKFAQFLDAFDRQYDLVDRYSRDITEPHLAVYNTLEHSQKNATVQIGSVTWKRAALQSKFAERGMRQLLSELDLGSTLEELQSLNDEKARLANQILM